jgi:hypothetical protein
MTVYYIFSRGEDPQQIHKANSPEELACTIAHSLMEYQFPVDWLMAVKESSPLVTMDPLRHQAFCSIELDEEKKSIWKNELKNLHKKIAIFKRSKNKIEKLFDEAIADLDNCFAESKHFNSTVPSDCVSSYRLFDSFQSDFEYKFNKKIKETFKYRKIKNQPVTI